MSNCEALDAHIVQIIVYILCSNRKRITTIDYLARKRLIFKKLCDQKLTENNFKRNNKIT